MINRPNKKIAQSENLVFLRYTHKINKQDAKIIPEWKFLSEQYDTVDDQVTAVLMSIQNSLIYQKRLIFTVSRDSLRELVTNDKNWGIRKKSFGLSNGQYKTIRHHLRLIAEKIEDIVVGYGTISIFEVTDEELLNIIKVNRDEQYAQTKKILIDLGIKKNLIKNTDAVTDAEYKNTNYKDSSHTSLSSIIDTKTLRKSDVKFINTQLDTPNGYELVVVFLKHYLENKNLYPKEALFLNLTLKAIKEKNIKKYLTPKRAKWLKDLSLKHQKTIKAPVADSISLPVTSQVLMGNFERVYDFRAKKKKENPINPNLYITTGFKGGLNLVYATDVYEIKSTAIEASRNGQVLDSYGITPDSLKKIGKTRKNIPPRASEEEILQYLKGLPKDN